MALHFCISKIDQCPLVLLLSSTKSLSYVTQELLENMFHLPYMWLISIAWWFIASGLAFGADILGILSK